MKKFLQLTSFLSFVVIIGTTLFVYLEKTHIRIARPVHIPPTSLQETLPVSPEKETAVPSTPAAPVEPEMKTKTPIAKSPAQTPPPASAPAQAVPKTKTVNLVATPPPLVPPPLRKEGTVAEGTLTVAGVVEWTNIYRQQTGVNPLKQNPKLTAAAQGKLNDMFTKQYFAHVSPSGVGPSYWVENAGYAYKLTGENLALGNFGSDKALVDAWMASPGHKENILKAPYEEIGVAVGKGMFEGQETWLAVQVFGDHMPQCASPDKNLQSQIDALQIEINDLQSQLAAKEQELEATEPKYGPEYNQTVDEYNALVGVYNPKVKELKEMVEAYNAEVNQYNVCISG